MSASKEPKEPNAVEELREKMFGKRPSEPESELNLLQKTREKMFGPREEESER